MRDTQLMGKILKIRLATYLIVGLLLTSLTGITGADAAIHQVPLSPFYHHSNEEWWMYQFDGREYGPEYWRHNRNCGATCSGMVINYLKGKNLHSKYNENISHHTQGTSTSLTATTLTDMDAYWIPDKVDDDTLVGLELNPNVNQTKTFTIVSNSEHTISVDEKDGNITSVATAGDSYAIYYHVYSETRWYYSQAYLHSRNIPPDPDADKPREHEYEGYYNDYKSFSHYGAHEEQIRYALSLEGIQSHTFTGNECKNDGTGIANLQNAIDQGKVCICLVDPSCYHDTDCHSHWAVVWGYDDDYIYLNDPGFSQPHKSGYRFKVNKSDFADAIWKVKELSIVIVVDTTLVPEILTPKESAPAIAGLKNNPNKIDVKLYYFIHGLTKNDFKVQIDGKTASIVSALELSEESEEIETKTPRYVLTVTPPTQDANGLYDLTVSVVKENAVLASDTEVDAVQYGVGNADVPLVIDRSGSMSGSKIADARNAAKQFVDFMSNGDQVGVVSFSGDARVDFPLTLITSNNVKEQAKSAINSLYAGGVTSIGDGLQAGQDELNSRGDATHAWTVLLLSDGLENTPAYVSDVLPGIPEKTDVYTIALGSDADQALMQDIATETGGEYYFSPSPDELQEIYNSIRGTIAGEQTITLKSGTVNEGETKTETVIVDFLVSLVRFLVSWSGSDIDLTLTDPNGLVIDPDVASRDPDISFVSGSTYEYYIINSPKSGQWRMNIEGVDTPWGGEDYTARVTGKSDLTLSTYFDKDRYETGQPITVLASLSDDSGPITGASVEVVVQAPSQSLSAWKSINGDTVPTKPLRESVPTLESLYKASLNVKSSGQQSLNSPVFYLYDDGAHGDGQANDGVYGNLYTGTSNSGSYIFNFEASGTSGGDSFSRITQRSLFVAQATATGSISGTISYSGSQTGTIYIQAWQSDPTMYGNPNYLTSISSTGSYLLSNLPDGSYYLDSYMDSNGNGIRDENEPRGVYGPPHMPNCVVVSGGNESSGVDITLTEDIICYPNPCYLNKGQIVKIANLLSNSKVYIYTISGDLVRTLDDFTEVTTRGSSAIATWDCKNNAGEEVARGIYIYLAKDDIGTKKTGKIAIIK